MSAVTAVPLRPLARGSVLKLWIAVGLLVLVAAGLGWWGTRGLQRSTMSSGVEYQVIREGSGDLISAADIVLVHFVGRKQDGEVFADTRRERQPLQATTDNFLPGVGEGLKLMRKGSVYRFWVPPRIWRGQLATQQAPFGPDETLTFDVQVVDVQQNGLAIQRAQQMQALQRQMQSGGNGLAPAPQGNAAAPVPAER
jgi:FKBP-type peptidyl-prolyl cis-trans isomerase FkpA